MIKDIIIHIEDALLTVEEGHDRRRGDGGEEPGGPAGRRFPLEPCASRIVGPAPAVLVVLAARC